MKYYLKCIRCSSEYASSYNRQICSKCNGILEVFYEGKFSDVRAKGTDFWAYEKFLPKCQYVHFKIGGTDLIKSKESNNLFLKLETENPTKSFKDRGTVIEIGKALEYKYNEVVCASTGNMAYSVAHYASLSGIKATVFISDDANPDKIKLISGVEGTEILPVKGDFVMAQQKAMEYTKRMNGEAFLVGDYCYRKEGQKTLAYELADQMQDMTHVIIPVGNATLISAVFKAFKELQTTKKLKRLPKIIAVQAKDCSPLVKAFNSSQRIEYQVPKTKADAIAVGFPGYGEQAMQALRETKGSAVTVTDSEMQKEQKSFNNTYGRVAELAGIASMAAYRKIKFSESDKVVAVISGGNV